MESQSREKKTMKPKERKKKFLATQVELLLDEVLEHQTILFGKRSGATAKLKIWTEITEKINATSAIKRSTKEVQKRFWDLKRRTKKKFATSNRHSRGTGRGPSTQAHLTPLEMKICPLINAVSVSGIDDGADLMESEEMRDEMPNTGNGRVSPVSEDMPNLTDVTCQNHPQYLSQSVQCDAMVSSQPETTCAETVQCGAVQRSAAVSPNSSQSSESQGEGPPFPATRRHPSREDRLNDLERRIKKISMRNANHVRVVCGIAEEMKQIRILVDRGVSANERIIQELHNSNTLLNRMVMAMEKISNAQTVPEPCTAPAAPEPCTASTSTTLTTIQRQQYPSTSKRGRPRGKGKELAVAQRRSPREREATKWLEEHYVTCL
ncbi:uncharacterized protein LOC117400342 [Acipenser ruthenus]|uniref:uncharacterized protein LOC117400342 n=1 Tax=Acipenser ruthenus TaxID=7906 RepID=UPI00145B1E5D|nr:uncharacterized protein LOC117400342 [Acipenser ruthenus]